MLMRTWSKSLRAPLFSSFLIVSRSISFWTFFTVDMRFFMMDSMLGSSFVLSLGGFGGVLGRWLVLSLLMRIAPIPSGFIIMIGSFFLGALFTSSSLCCFGGVLRMMVLEATGVWSSSSSSLQSLVLSEMSMASFVGSLNAWVRLLDRG